MSMQITLSTDSAIENWGKNAVLSFNNDGAVIHFSAKKDRTLVQKAARKLREQGIKDVTLNGADWDLESCWAFYQGFYTAKQDYSIEFPELADEPNAELLARIQCGDFVREIINLSSAEITPEELAKRAASFIVEQAQAYDYKSAVDFRIVLGEELNQQNYQGIWQVGQRNYL